MSEKKLNAIKEIEFRINKVKELCNDLNTEEYGSIQYFDKLEQIDNYLFDINDFINDLKDDKT